MKVNVAHQVGEYIKRVAPDSRQRRHALRTAAATASGDSGMAALAVAMRRGEAGGEGSRTPVLMALNAARYMLSCR
jgi:hypothetical protein